MINLPICPPLVLDIVKFIVGADRGAEQAESRVEWSGAVSMSCRKTVERSAERGLERGAAFSPLTFHSHALVRGRSGRWTV